MNENITNLKNLQRIAKKHGAYFIPYLPYDNPLSQTPEYFNPRCNNLNNIFLSNKYQFHSLETNKKLENVNGVDWGGWFTWEELTDFLTAAKENRLNDPKYKY